jgi:hypothetical protein
VTKVTKAIVAALATHYFLEDERRSALLAAAAETTLLAEHLWTVLGPTPYWEVKHVHGSIDRITALLRIVEDPPVVTTERTPLDAYAVFL